MDLARSRIRDQIILSTRRRFVGRKEEGARFLAALGPGNNTLAWLRVEGPGGVGKSTLLARFHEIAREAGVDAALIQAAAIEPAPQAFLEACAHGLGFDPIEPVTDGGRFVLLIDGFDTLAPLHGWFTTVFLPQLPAGALVVTAARRLNGQLGFDLRSLSETIRLRNFSLKETNALLRSAGIPGDQGSAVQALTHGHPLAVAIAADTIRHSGSLGDTDRIEICPCASRTARRRGSPSGSTQGTRYRIARACDDGGPSGFRFWR